MQTDVGVTDSPIREIVGVVGDVKRSSLTEESKPEYYIPIEQGPLAPPSVAIRVTGDAASYEASVRAVVARMDSSLPVYRVRTYAEDLARITAQQRFEAVLLSGFAAIALLLSAVGLYGVLSYMVGQRTKEIGLRMALGAQRSTVRNQILRQGLTLSVAGLGLGGAVAALLTRFIASLLFGVGRFDALTFAGMALLLFAVTCVASLAPAYRASRLEPMEALRAE
jgi:ABC-type antimicrobial peptide transport system permease subunit